MSSKGVSWIRWRLNKHHLGELEGGGPPPPPLNCPSSSWGVGMGGVQDLPLVVDYGNSLL